MSETIETSAPSSRLFNRDFVLLWQGQFVSQMGSQAFAVAMMFWTMEATGSASLMGVLMMASSLPAVLLGPFAGTVADRHSRKRILVVCDLVSGLVMLGLAVPFFVPGTGVRVLVTCLVTMAVLLGVAQAFFRPAIGAAIPDLVPKPRVAAANSLNQFSMQLALMLGQSLGGLLYRFIGAPLLFVIDGVSYVFSAVSEAFIRLPALPRREEAEASPWQSFRRDLVHGLGFVWQNRGMRGFLALAAAVNFFAMPIIVMLPFFVTLNLERDAAWYGFLIATLGAGSIVGFVLAGALPLQGSKRALALLVNLLVQGGLMAAFGFVRQPVLALVLVALQGALGGFLNIILMTTFQMATPAELRGRVMGVVSTVAMAVAPLGMGLGGLLGDLTGKNIPLIFGICGALIALATIVLGFPRPVREFLAFSTDDPVL